MHYFKLCTGRESWRRTLLPGRTKHKSLIPHGEQERDICHHSLSPPAMPLWSKCHFNLAEMPPWPTERVPMQPGWLRATGEDGLQAQQSTSSLLPPGPAPKKALKLHIRSRFGDDLEKGELVADGGRAHKTQLPKWNQSISQSTARYAEHQVYWGEAVLVWKYCIKRNIWSLLSANKNTQNTLSFGFKCRKDGRFRVFFLGHNSLQTRHNSQPSHRDGEMAIFGCFFLMSLPLLSIQETCPLRRAVSQLNEYRDRSCTQMDRQTDTQLLMFHSLDEVSLFSLSFIRFLLPKKTPR